MKESEITRLFPQFEQELLVELLKAGGIKTLRTGEMLVRTGQQIRSAMLILSGLVKVYRQDESGDEYFIYYIDAGKACAISLACATGIEKSGLMARAVTKSTILAIPSPFVNEWMGKYRSWAEFTVNSYRDRFEELLQTIDQIAFRSMDERLIFYLKRHVESTKSNILPTSFTEIAHELNSSREVISRLMKKLADRKMVRLYKSHVEIVSIV